MLNNRETFTIDLRDLYGSKLDKAASNSEKQTVKINKGLKSVSSTAKTTKKDVNDLDKTLTNVDKKKIKIKVDDSEVVAAGKKVKALQAGARSTSSGGGGGLGLGALGKGLLVGAVASIGFGGLSSAAQNAIAATSKYEKFEAVLSNTLGSKGAAKSQMQSITDFATKTPFQVEELTEGFVKLANQGFTPTLRQMTSLGDLAASTGKTYDQLVEAILDAQTGEFERLKEFGIRASVQGNKVAFTFKGQTTVVNKSAEAMRNYVLSLGNAVGVSGAMEKISETTGGQISNLTDNVDLLWKAVGERFNPEIKGSVGVLSKFVSTLRSWVEIPVENKIQDEITRIKGLQVELTSSNTTHERQLQILNELKDINPRIVDGIDAQSVSYSKLAKNIDAVVTGLQNQKMAEIINKQNSDLLGNVALYQGKKSDALNNITAILGQINDPRLLDRNLTTGQKQVLGQKILQQRVAKQGNNFSLSATDDAVLLSKLQGAIYSNNDAVNFLNYNAPKVKEINTQIANAKKIYDQMAGISSTGTTGTTNKGTSSTPTKTGSIDTAGINSVNGGAGIKNINISIGSLISGGFNINTTTLKEGVTKAKDVIVEGLLTAVNDANLAGGNQ